MNERGSVTAEFALTLPAVVMVLGLLLGSASWGLDQLRAASAASTGARVAIVESDGAARAAAQRVAGDGSTVTLTRAGGWVTVTVTLAPRLGVLATSQTMVAYDTP